MLVKMGADRSDCFIDFFEMIDANVKCIDSQHKEPYSLKWLAAKALAREYKPEPNTPEEINVTVDSARKYARLN